MSDKLIAYFENTSAQIHRLAKKALRSAPSKVHGILKEIASLSLFKRFKIDPDNLEESRTYAIKRAKARVREFGPQIVFETNSTIGVMTKSRFPKDNPYDATWNDVIFDSDKDA
jgi:hypothetical protein